MNIFGKGNVLDTGNQYRSPGVGAWGLFEDQQEGWCGAECGEGIGEAPREASARLGTADRH